MKLTDSEKIFKELLLKSVVEKAPENFTQKVMQRIIPNFEVARLPLVYKPKFWILLASTITLFYILIARVGIAGTQIKEYFYFNLENLTNYIYSIDFYTTFVQIVEYMRIYLERTGEVINTLFISEGMINWVLLFTVPVIFIILSQVYLKRITMIRNTANL